jgi:hypothetical protein
MRSQSAADIRAPVVISGRSRSENYICRPPRADNLLQALTGFLSEPPAPCMGIVSLNFVDSPRRQIQFPDVIRRPASLAWSASCRSACPPARPGPRKAGRLHDALGGTATVRSIAVGTRREDERGLLSSRGRFGRLRLNLRHLTDVSNQEITETFLASLSGGCRWRDDDRRRTAPHAAEPVLAHHQVLTMASKARSQRGGWFLPEQRRGRVSAPPLSAPGDLSAVPP